MPEAKETIESKQRKSGRRSHVQEGEMRESILQAATKIFADVGYEAASMSAIAKKCGVTKPMIFYYFGSKKELFEEILKNVHENCFSLIKKALFDSSRPIMARLETVCDLNELFAKNSRDELRFYHTMVAMQAKNFMGEERLRHIFTVYELLLKAVSEAVARGELQGEAEVIAAAIYAAFTFGHMQRGMISSLKEEANDTILQQTGYKPVAVKDMLKLVINGAIQHAPLNIQPNEDVDEQLA